MNNFHNNYSVSSDPCLRILCFSILYILVPLMKEKNEYIITEWSFNQSLKLSLNFAWKKNNMQALHILYCFIVKMVYIIFHQIEMYHNCPPWLFKISLITPGKNMFLTISGTLVKVEKWRHMNDAASPCLIQYGLAANTEVLQSIDWASPVSDHESQGWLSMVPSSLYTCLPLNFSFPWILCPMGQPAVHDPGSCSTSLGWKDCSDSPLIGLS